MAEIIDITENIPEENIYLLEDNDDVQNVWHNWEQD